MNTRWIAAAAAACALGLLAVPMMLRSAERISGPQAVTAADAKSDGKSCSAEGTANLDLTLKDMNGASVRLADYKGKVILLNFWGTWCPPCQAEIPDLIKAYEAHRDAGFVVLGMTIDDTAEDMRAYAAARKVTYPLLMMQDDVEQAYGPIVGVPMSFFIARDGSICKKHFGPVTYDQVEREIKALL